MDIIFIYVIFFILVIVYMFIDNKNTKIKHNMDHNKLIDKIELNNIVLKNRNNDKLFIIKNKNDNYNDYCQVPTLNSEQCLKSKFNKCCNENGSYQQCTNNILPTNFHALCENRAFEMTISQNKVSQNCFNKLN